MSMMAFRMWPVAFLLLASAGRSQEISTPPKGWHTMSTIYDPLYDHFLPIHPRLILANNTSDAIRQELLDTDLFRIIAKANGLSDEELAKFQIRQERGAVELYYFGDSDPTYTTFSLMSRPLQSFAEAREAGHTRDFALGAITNRTDPSTVSDPDLRAILQERPTLPVDRLRRVASGSYTNKAGIKIGRTRRTTNGPFYTTNLIEMTKVDEVGRRVLYVLVDGEVASEYEVRFNSHGIVDDVSESLCDGKEYDPKYSRTIRDAMHQATAELTTEGVPHRLGYVHVFWQRVKKMLKEKGIDWHSPAEMNPTRIYD
jgi:hypothetical protein